MVRYMGRISLHLVVLAAKEPNKLLCHLQRCSLMHSDQKLQINEFYKINETHKCGWLQAEGNELYHCDDDDDINWNLVYKYLEHTRVWNV